MSHFVTAVFAPANIATNPNLLERYLEEKLAPYDANLLVDEYERDCHCIGMVARQEASERADADFGTIGSLRASFATLVLTDGRCVYDIQASLDALVLKRDASEEENAECKVLGKEIYKLWESHIKARRDAEKRYFEGHPMKDAPDHTCGFYTGERKFWWPEDVTEGDRCDGCGCGGTGTYRSTENPNYKWDWWVIGGNWNGWLAPPEAQPEKDPDNWRSCGTCSGTGMKADALDICSACDGVGKELVWVPEQKDSGFNVVAPQYIMTLGLLGELPTPFAFVDLLGEWHEPGDACDDDDWTKEWRAALAEMSDDLDEVRVVVVDMHI